MSSLQCLHRVNPCRKADDIKVLSVARAVFIEFVKQCTICQPIKICSECVDELPQHRHIPLKTALLPRVGFCCVWGLFLTKTWEVRTELKATCPEEA